MNRTLLHPPAWSLAAALAAGFASGQTVLYARDAAQHSSDGSQPSSSSITSTRAPSENLQLFDFWKIYSDAPNALYKDFVDDALARLRERKQAIARLESSADWERYRKEAQRKLAALIGPVPEKTPLNARVLGVVHKEDFRIEKLVYESQPGLYVTAALFVPEPLRGRAPAILYCSGHYDSSFLAPGYQSSIVNLVKKGFVVLAFDPIGQGERLQYYNPATGLSEFGAGSSTREHSRAGSQCMITGSSLARHMIWDGIRSIDYLVSREEVDPSRIGITGRSGGGTQTAYIAAIDGRIHAAAPEVYLTTFEQLLKSRGPQDAEQNFYKGIDLGFDQADFLIARAPRPALILATTRDIFSIDGVQAVHAEARRAYAALGRPDSIAISVDDADHATTTKNREALHAFFQRHLALPGDPVNREVGQLTDDELRVTATGQVATSFAGETVFSLNRGESAALVRTLEQRRRGDLPAHLARVKEEAAQLAGYDRLTKESRGAVFSGRYHREGYVLEKYLLPVDDRYAIPVLVMRPAKLTADRVVLYLHPDGKAAAANAGGEMEWLVKQGCTVIAPDIIGAGELGPGYLFSGHNRPNRPWFGYAMMGKSIVGRQMTDLMRTVRFAQDQFGAAPGELMALAHGAFGPLLLHTAAIEGIFARVALIEAPISYRSIVMTEHYEMAYISSTVPSALTAYDLPDLAACIAPGKLLLVDPRGGNGAPADAETLEQDSAVIARAFAIGAEKNFNLHRGSANRDLGRALESWLE